MLSLGLLLALLSALVWGSGDFVGGVATRRGSQFQVLALSAFSGVILLLALAIVRETLPPPSSLAWAGVAGLTTAVGITSLYLVTRTPSGEQISSRSLKLALLAGTGFGAFLIIIAQVGGRLVFVPLAVARTVTLLTALLLLRLRGATLPSPASNQMALLAGVLDAGGNVFFVLAQQHTRLDVAAVLSSLYPVATVALASVVWKERVSASQWAGIAACLVAVALMAG